MPFTLAHSAILLPVASAAHRRGLLSALVIGTMAPDFGYFVPGSYVHAHTHTPASLLWFSLPVGVLVWWVYRRLMGPALLAIAPPAWQKALAEPAPKRPRGDVAMLAAAGLSVLAGAATHFLFDACTHADGAIARNVPFFQAVVFEPPGGPITISKLLQHTLSILGLAALGVAILRWSKSLPASSKAWAGWKKGVVVALLLLPAGVAAGSFLIYQNAHRLKHAIGHAAVGGLESFGLALLLWGALWTWRRRGDAPEGNNQ